MKSVLSSCEKNVQYCYHSSLTPFIKKHRQFNMADVMKDVLNKCSVQTYVGSLPPELLNKIKYKNVSSVTYQFIDALNFFLIENKSDLINRTYNKYRVKSIEGIFHTPCILDVSFKVPYLDCVYKVLGGSVGDVFRLSFPKLGAAYALKLFKYDIISSNHGALIEIPTAFWAYNLDSKHNNCVYIGNLFGESFLLSKWIEDKDTHNNNINIIQKKNPMFKLDKAERRTENYKGGKLIDFGGLKTTVYAKQPYAIRKIVRQLQNSDIKQISSIQSKYKSYIDIKNFNIALNLWDQLNH